VRMLAAAPSDDIVPSSLAHSWSCYYEVHDTHYECKTNNHTIPSLPLLPPSLSPHLHLFLPPQYTALYNKNSSTTPTTAPSCVLPWPLPEATDRVKRVEVLEREALKVSNELLCSVVGSSDVVPRTI
jgi:hypothetical protein